MMVFCAEITITGRPGRIREIRGSASSPLPSGMMTSRDHQIALALFDPAHQRHQARSHAPCSPPASAPGSARCGSCGRRRRQERCRPSYRSFRFSLGAMGSETRNTVRPGTDSTEIQPSWSEMIFDTSARPRPVPFSRPETKGSNTSPAMSGGRPGPSSMISMFRGSAAARCHPCGARAATGRRRCAAGWCRPWARRLGGVLDQVQEHLHQLVGVGRSAAARGRNPRRWSYARRTRPGRAAGAVQRIVDVHRAAVGRAQVAELFDLFQKLHDPPGFLDDQVGQSRGPRPVSPIDRSCAAPEMPASGFLISCASISAMPMADFAAVLVPIERPSRSAISRGRQDQQHDAGVVVHRRQVDRALHRRRVRRWSRRHR
jgi:hypothetical protein